MAKGHRMSVRGPQVSQRQFTDFLVLLSSLKSGSLIVSANALPMLKVDSESRSLSIEAAGIKESGLRLRKMLVGGGQERSVRSLLTSAESMAKKLSEVGWTLTFYDKGHGLLSMGNGVSRYTGHIKANPLKLRRLLQTL